MADNGTKDAEGSTAVSTAEPPRSLPIAAKGVVTGEDFARLMSSLMSDVIEGRLTPDVANATCNAGGKLLKVVEMQFKYGSQSDERRTKPFMLAPDTNGSEQGAGA